MPTFRAFAYANWDYRSSGNACWIWNRQTVVYGMRRRCPFRCSIRSKRRPQENREHTKALILRESFILVLVEVDGEGAARVEPVLVTYGAELGGVEYACQ